MCLQKRLFYLEDRDGKLRSLHYLRTKEGKEVDFVTVEGGQPLLMVEVKASDRAVTTGLRYFRERYPIPGIQLVGDLRVETEHNGLSVRQAFPWLQALEV
jgi:predicted AAA+ superfamily ATPase